MRKRVVTWLLLLAAIAVQAQTQSDLILMVSKEGKMIAIPKFMTYELNIPKFAYKTYTPSMNMGREFERQLRAFAPDLPPAVDERPMDMQVLSAAYAPFYNEFTPMLRRVSPMMLDFNELSTTRISDNVNFWVQGQQYTWPGAGGITRVTTALSWHKDRWEITGGAFAGRFYTPFNLSPGFMGGVNAQVSFEATDWLKIRGWGQYAEYGKEDRNPHMLMNPFFNHTNVGGALEFKFNDKFGMGVGVNYEYNPMRRKMERQQLIYPIFFR